MNFTTSLPPPLPLPQELPRKVQQVLGLYVPSSSEEEGEDSPDSQASEMQRLPGRPQPGDAGEAGAACSDSACGPTYP